MNLDDYIAGALVNVAHDRDEARAKLAVKDAELAATVADLTARLKAALDDVEAYRVEVASLKRELSYLTNCASAVVQIYKQGSPYVGFDMHMEDLEVAVTPKAPTR